jgi:hypothetical protein
MKIKLLLLYFLLSLSLLGLNLNEGGLSLTNPDGKLNTAILANIKTADKIIIKRADGFVYKAEITQVEESPDYFKIWGKMYNQEETFFGITLNRGGILAGAISEFKTGKVYVLEFSQLHEGFIFLYSTLHSKMFI